MGLDHGSASGVISRRRLFVKFALLRTVGWNVNGSIGPWDTSSIASQFRKFFCLSNAYQRMWE
jgi:hypothetical protein